MFEIRCKELICTPGVSRVSVREISGIIGFPDSQRFFSSRIYPYDFHHKSEAELDQSLRAAFVQSADGYSTNRSLLLLSSLSLSLSLVSLLSRLGGS